MHFALAGAVALTLLGHDLPFGQIERNLQAVVEHDRIEVAYQLGLSDATIQRELRLLGLPLAQIAAAPGPALEQYARLTLPRFGQGLRLRCGGQNLTLEPEGWEHASARSHHHLRVVLRYQAKLAPTAARQELELRDENLPNTPGVGRLACKPRPPVEFLACSAAPLVARAEKLTISGADQAPRVISAVAVWPAEFVKPAVAQTPRRAIATNETIRPRGAAPPQRVSQQASWWQGWEVGWLGAGVFAAAAFRARWRRRIAA